MTEPGSPGFSLALVSSRTEGRRRAVQEGQKKPRARQCPKDLSVISTTCKPMPGSTWEPESVAGNVILITYQGTWDLTSPQMLLSSAHAHFPHFSTRSISQAGVK
jgi:hypothetical protein